MSEGAPDLTGWELEEAQRCLQEGGREVQVVETVAPERLGARHARGERRRVIQQRDTAEGTVLVVAREIELSKGAEG